MHAHTRANAMLALHLPRLQSRNVDGVMLERRSEALQLLRTQRVGRAQRKYRTSKNKLGLANERRRSACVEQRSMNQVSLVKPLVSAWVRCVGSRANPLGAWLLNPPVPTRRCMVLMYRLLRGYCRQ